MAAFFTRTLQIEWGQCDPAGIVYAPRYFDIFNETTVLLFQFAGLPKKREMQAQMKVLGFPSVSMEAQFHAPTSYGDQVVVECAAPEFGRTSFIVRQRLLCEGRLCVDYSEKRVWAVQTAEGGMKAAPVPEAVRALFATDEE